MMNGSKGAKTVLVTGATSGIGYELSKTFARNGYNLVLVARNEDKLEKLAEELAKTYGVSAKIISKDLADPKSPEEIFSELQQKSIQVEILVNNAGFQVYGLFTEIDIYKELQMIQVHLSSLTHLTKLFLPAMVKRGYGKILNVGSTGSFVPGPLNAVYCATKAYILSFSEALAEELKGTNITVTTICPGATRTEFARRAGIEDIRLFKFQCGLMEAEDVADTAYLALMQGKRTVVVGITNKLTIQSLRFMPRMLSAKITKFLMSRA